MPPRRVQMKSTIATVIAEAKKNFDAQKEGFQRAARDLVEEWHQNSLRNFDALQMRISEHFLNDGYSEKRPVIAKEKPVEEFTKIDRSMPSLEPPTEEPSVADLIQSLEHFVAEEAPVHQVKSKVVGKSLQSSVDGTNSPDPIFGFANLPVVMTPSKSIMNTTFDMDLSNSPVTFSEYELNEIGELTLLSVDIENGNFGEQISVPNGSHKALQQSNHSIPLVKQHANGNKRVINEHHTTGAIPIKRRKKDENAVPNATKLLNEPKTGLMHKMNVANKETLGSTHKIIIDKETLAQMREQKKKTKKGVTTKNKATTAEVALSF